MIISSGAYHSKLVQADSQEKSPAAVLEVELVVGQDLVAAEDAAMEVVAHEVEEQDQDLPDLDWPLCR